ncbi:MAG: hypothetical protein AAF125_01965 [Chloroflexota bacterium]
MGQPLMQSAAYTWDAGDRLAFVATVTPDIRYTYEDNNTSLNATPCPSKRPGGCPPYTRKNLLPCKQTPLNNRTTCHRAAICHHRHPLLPPVGPLPMFFRLPLHRDGHE